MLLLQIRALYWLAILVVGTAVTLRGLVIIIEDYLSRPSVTTNSYITPPSVPFPAVTVCNLNRIHCLNLVEVRMGYNSDGTSDLYDVNASVVDNLIFNETNCNDQVRITNKKLTTYLISIDLRHANN